jgi:predicted ATPase/class 3 adenylate cyclase/tetratricopeptide (TPR) repeat protein
VSNNGLICLIGRAVDKKWSYVMNNTATSEPILPGGTVTFLFTDIEGSTQLLDRLRDQYEELISVHHSIIRQALARWNGREIDTEGDAFFAVFPRATEAVNAVVDIQRDLNKQAWPEGVQVRVRMGLHTGEPWLVEEGYMGMDVHRAARVGHVGFGGQVLLSETTTALVQDELPEGVSLLDLGSHRLKDMRRPEPIHQLVIEGLPSEFPPLKTLDAFRTNLPEQLSTFIGRGQEMTEIGELITNHRLLTLVGPGGSGKTRLSLQVASNLIGAFPQGVWFVDLEKIESPDYLIPAVANTLQFSIDSYSSNLEPRRQLLDYLSRQSLLMVMDNFEHLLEGAGLLTDILNVSPETRLMVTSRERLNLREEWIYPMSGLRYPHNGNGAGVEAFSGLALFTERAKQIEPSFDLTRENLPDVSRICQLVDGLPLGIELAAAWVNVLTCEEIAEEIESDIDFLATTMHDVPEKHRSLRAIFNQSWRRIPKDQQAGFRRLAVFRGGFRREAAQDVAGVSLAMLSQFIQKSLLNRDKQGRFVLHPLIKAFAGEKLDETPQERDSTYQLHSRHYVQFLIDRRQRIHGESMRKCREEMRAESGNIWAAVEWAITRWEDEDEAYNALRSFALYAQTEGFHSATAYYRRLEKHLRKEGADIQSDTPKIKLLLSILTFQAANGATIGDPESETIIQNCMPLLREPQLTYELGVALLAAGIRSGYRSEYVDAIRTLEESLTYLRSQDDHFMTIASLSWLGWAYYELGELDKAGRYFQDSYDVCIEHDNVLGLPYALSKLGTWADALKQYERGAAYHQEALKYFEAIGDQAGQGYALSRISLSAWGMKAYDQSLDFGQMGYEQFEAIGHSWGMATTPIRIGFAELAMGRYDPAQSHFANYALIGLGMLWAQQGEITRSVELLTMAVESSYTPFLYQAIGYQALEEIEGELPPDLFIKIQEEARAKELQDAIDEIRWDSLSAGG